MPRLLLSLSMALLFLALQPAVAAACPGKQGAKDKHKVALVTHKDGKATARFTTDKGAEAVKALQKTLAEKVATYSKGKPVCKPGCKKKASCPLAVKGLKLEAKKIKTGMELVATGPEKALKEFASAVEKRGKIGGFCSCGGDKAKCGCGAHKDKKGDAPHAHGAHGGCPHAAAAGGKVFKPESAKPAGGCGGCPHAKTGGCGAQEDKK